MNDTDRRIIWAFKTLLDAPIEELRPYQREIEDLLPILAGKCEPRQKTNAGMVTKSLSPWDQEKLRLERRKKEMEERTAKIMRETEYLVRGSNKGSVAEVVHPTVEAKAAYYRTRYLNGDMAAVCKAYEGLGALPAGSAALGYGNNLLPTNLSRELLTEPVDDNSLRRIERVSQIRGLEEPKINISIDDATLEDVTDQETAREIEMTGDTVVYGRFKTKIMATIKDTVLYGTELNLVETVETALRSGLAIKEKINAFRTTSDGVHDHMSFYLNGIKEVEGPDIIQAIMSAWADLPEMFSGNASVVMRKQDYFAAIRTLANGSADLWGEKPEDVVGIPVIFNDRAVTPIVGDFRYARQNYDIGAILDTDKDVESGDYYFVLTAWGDHQIRLKSAFRLAKVAAAAVG